MAREPSTETKLKTALRELSNERKQREFFEGEARRLRAMLAEAQASANEWRQRFDLLLSKVGTAELTKGKS